MLLLHLSIFVYTHSVGNYWMSVMPVAEASTNATHKIHKR